VVLGEALARERGESGARGGILETPVRHELDVHARRLGEVDALCELDPPRRRRLERRDEDVSLSQREPLGRVPAGRSAALACGYAKPLQEWPTSGRYGWLVTRVPRQILVYVFRRRDDGVVDFLLLRRLDHRGGFWQGVTGAPERQETDAQAAVREVFEETGFDVETAIAAIDHRYLLHRPTGDPAQWDRLYGPEVMTVPEEVYVAEAPGRAEPVLAPAEHDAFTWCELETALGLLAWEENRRALVAAHESIAPAGASMSP